MREDCAVRPFLSILVVALLMAAVAVSCGKKKPEGPQTAEDYVKRAQASFLDPDKAIRDLDKAIELDDAFVPAYEQRAELYETRYHKTNRAKDAQQAIRDYGKMLALEPESPKTAEWLRKRGWFKLQLKRYDAAIADLNRSIEMDDGESRSYQYLGEAYRAKGDLERAAESYTDAIACDRNDVSLYMSRCEIHHALKDYPKVVLDLTKVIEIQPTAQAYIRRAEIYRELGEPHKALDDIEKAKKLDPGYDPDTGAW